MNTPPTRSTAVTSGRVFPHILPPNPRISLCLMQASAFSESSYKLEQDERSSTWLRPAAACALRGLGANLVGRGRSWGPDPMHRRPRRCFLDVCAFLPEFCFVVCWYRALALSSHMNVHEGIAVSSAKPSDGELRAVSQHGTNHTLGTLNIAPLHTARLQPVPGASTGSHVETAAGFHGSLSKEITAGCMCRYGAEYGADPPSPASILLALLSSQHTR